MSSHNRFCGMYYADAVLLWPGYRGTAWNRGNFRMSISEEVIALSLTIKPRDLCVKFLLLNGKTRTDRDMPHTHSCARPSALLSITGNKPVFLPCCHRHRLWQNIVSFEKLKLLPQRPIFTKTVFPPEFTSCPWPYPPAAGLQCATCSLRQQKAERSFYADFVWLYRALSRLLRSAVTKGKGDSMACVTRRRPYDKGKSMDDHYP
jgi:hypothetical protein